MTEKLVLQWLPCQVPGIMQSVLGLVGPVSVHCEMVSLVRHVQLWKQIRP